MTCRLAKPLLGALTALISTNSEATCLNRENTSLPESTPTSSFTILPDGTLMEPKYGLMWKRCLEGQVLVGSLCEGTPTIFTWPDAMNAAHVASFAGHGDWRLPNPKELLSIFEDRCAAPGLNADLFPISGVFGIWTSTPTAFVMEEIVDEIWMVDPDGVVMSTTKFQEIQVLLVRNVP